MKKKAQTPTIDDNERQRINERAAEQLIERLPTRTPDHLVTFQNKFPPPEYGHNVLDHIEPQFKPSSSTTPQNAPQYMDFEEEPEQFSETQREEMSSEYSRREPVPPHLLRPSDSYYMKPSAACQEVEDLTYMLRTRPYGAPKIFYQTFRQPDAYEKLAQTRRDQRSSRQESAAYRSFQVQPQPMQIQEEYQPLSDDEGYMMPTQQMKRDRKQDLIQQPKEIVVDGTSPPSNQGEMKQFDSPKPKRKSWKFF